MENRLKLHVLLLITTLSSYLLHGAAQSYDLFAQAEYDHYMQLIKSIDPITYGQLVRCEKELGQPCIRNAVDATSIVQPGNARSKEHPIIFMESIQHHPEPYQKAMLTYYLDWYKNIKQTLPITKSEQKTILKIINDIAPTLYEEIIKVDPTGQHHIKRNYHKGFSATASVIDGLPVISVHQDSTLDYSNKELRAILAHELSHYILKHPFKSDAPIHTYLFNKNTPVKQFAAGKQVAGQLQPTKCFARSEERIEEYEADRSEVLDFGIDIDTAIKVAKKLQQQELELSLAEPHKETFKSTHPLWADRINHFESLRSEVELKKAHDQGKTHIDWKKLAQEYLDELKKK